MTCYNTKESKNNDTNYNGTDISERQQQQTTAYNNSSQLITETITITIE